MIWMDVDTAVTVPVNKVPLIDDTDFKTVEEAVAFNAAGLEVIWHFITSAGVQTATVITPTDTAGVYDWTHVDGGIYKIEIPASGGVSVNNATEGFGWITGKATGVLPWSGPIIGFRAAALNNSLVDGTTIDVNVTAMAASVLTAAAIASNAIEAAKIATGAITAAKFGAGAIDAAAIATGAIDADALAADAVTELWTTALTESYAADGVAPTPAQILFMIWSFLTEKAVSGVTITAKKLDGTTTSMTFSVNDATNPSTITRAT